MQIIGVCGRKGGSGKTTIAVHLAAELAERGSSTVLIDCDLQGSATYWAEPKKLPMPVQHLPIESEKEVRLWLRQVQQFKADYLVIDSPPHLEAPLGAIIGLSDIAVIPCGPSGLDLIATGETVGLVREIRKANRRRKPVMILVPNRVDYRTASGRELNEALSDLEEAVAPEIRSRMAFADAFNAGQWVGSYSPNSMAHLEMKALANFVLQTARKQTWQKEPGSGRVAAR